MKERDIVQTINWICGNTRKRLRDRVKRLSQECAGQHFIKSSRNCFHNQRSLAVHQGLHFPNCFPSVLIPDFWIQQNKHFLPNSANGEVHSQCCPYQKSFPNECIWHKKLQKSYICICMTLKYTYFYFLLCQYSCCTCPFPNLTLVQDS